MSILITASLSSKMYNFVPTCEHFAFEGTNQHAIIQENSVLDCFLCDVLLGDKFHRSGLSFCFRFESECNASIMKFQRSSAGTQSIRNPASKEIFSASVELCETHICFLHIQLMGTDV